MKYFGKKSVSSVISIILNVSWYLVLVMAVVGVIAISAIIFSPQIQNFISSEMAKDAVKNAKDLAEWNEFMSVPLFVKMLIFPYGIAVVTFLLLIIRKSRSLFENFRNDVVFNAGNVQIIAAANKLLIVFSIITFNFSGLFTCVLLLMLGEIFKNASALQEEHDLTV